MELNEIRFQAMGTNNWIGTPAASAYLGVGLRTLYRLIDQGHIPAYQMGRVIRVKQEDLDVYLERARIEPGALRHLYPDPDDRDKGHRTESP